MKISGFRTVHLFCAALIWSFAAAPALAQVELDFVGDVASARAFMADLAQAYEQQGSGKIKVDGTGTRAAIAAVRKGEVDLAGSARPAIQTISDENLVAFYPVAWDALVVIAHPNNPVSNLSVKQLRSVISGETRNWSGLGGDSATIQYIHTNEKEDGIDHVARQLLLGDARSELAGRAVDNTLDVEKAVEEGRHAMGLTTYSAARRLKVKILSLEGVMPGIDTIQSGNYLLFTPVYLVVNERGPKRREVRDFVRFAQSAVAKRIVRNNGAVPYTDGLSLVSRQLDRESELQRRMR